MGVKNNEPRAIIRTQLQAIGDEISAFLAQNANIMIKITGPPCKVGLWQGCLLSLCCPCQAFTCVAKRRLHGFVKINRAPSRNLETQLPSSAPGTPPNADIFLQTLKPSPQGAL